LFPQLAGVDSTPPAVEHISGQSVKLFDLEQAAPDPSAQFRFRQILQNELGFEDAAELAVGAISIRGYS
jgi:hypothetical protein